MGKVRPLEPVVKRARELLKMWEETFSDYEIENVMAELEVGTIKVKAAMRVSMKKKT